jgi:ubiquinone biosynthesis protein COQ9
LAARSQYLFPDGVSNNGAGARVEALTWERLMGNKDIIHRWQEVRRSWCILVDCLLGVHD